MRICIRNSLMWPWFIWPTARGLGRFLRWTIAISPFTDRDVEVRSALFRRWDRIVCLCFSFLESLTEGYSMPFKYAGILAITFAFLVSSANAQQTGAARYTPALDVMSMDRSIDPCVDFFAYSCGGWIKGNPIPPDQSSLDTY